LYSFPVSKEESEDHEGAQAWHMGKILEKLLTCATNDKERLLAVASLDQASNILTSIFSDQSMANKLKSIMGI
jgi:hypothetical protein